MPLHFALIRRSIGYSTLAVLPFFILQWMNRAPFAPFPFFLFLLLWLLPFLFLILVLPVRSLIQAKQLTAVWIRIITAALLAWCWLSLLQDQLPCFLGIPNCD